MRPYYDRDGITLYHADCREVLPSIDPATVALVIADPPYGVNERTTRRTNGRSGGTLDSGAWPSRDFAPVHDDDKPFDPSHLLGFPRLILFGANFYADRLPSSPSWLIWDKLDGLTSKRSLGFNDNADVEMIWTNLGGPARLIPHRWTGLLQATEIGRARVHPTQKPVALMERLIERYTNPGDLVVDPYMGSGPVPRACMNLGRRCVACEVVAGYCAVAVRSLAQTVLPLEVPA